MTASPTCRTATPPVATRTRLLTRIAPVGLPLAFVLLWSSGFVGAELGVRVTSVDTLLMWRFVVATAVLMSVCLLTGRRIDAAALRRHVPLGVLMQFAYLFGAFHGVESGVSGSTVALVAALQPLLVALAAVVALGERLSVLAGLGLCVGLGGVALVVGDGLVGVGGGVGGGVGDAPGWAYLLPIGGMVCLAAGTVRQQRSADRTDLLVALTVQSATAAVCFTAWALLAGRAAPAPTWEFVGAIAWVVALAGFGGYGTYLLVLRRHGAATVSALLYLTPPTTAVWTAVMFGTPLRAAALAGMATAVAGVLLFLWARHPPSAAGRWGRQAPAERVAAGPRPTPGRRLKPTRRAPARTPHPKETPHP